MSCRARAGASVPEIQVLVLAINVGDGQTGKAGSLGRFERVGHFLLVRGDWCLFFATAHWCRILFLLIKVQLFFSFVICIFVHGKVLLLLLVIVFLVVVHLVGVTLDGTTAPSRTPGGFVCGGRRGNLVSWGGFSLGALFGVR
jgi:hypothetical protein